MKQRDPAWNRLTWHDLDFPANGSRMVLRHNGRLQYGYTLNFNESVGDALQKMQKYCAEHPHGNPKITGVKKCVEHAKIDNMDLWAYMVRRLAKAAKAAK